GQHHRRGDPGAGRPLAGARIETPAIRRSRPCRWSPPRGGADRNLLNVQNGTLELGSPPRGGADRNASSRRILLPIVVAPSRRRGSKLRARCAAIIGARRPLAGARIETT